MTSEPASQDFPPRRDAILERGGLTGRIPGQAVIEKLLADRAGAPSRSYLGRIFGADPVPRTTRVNPSGWPGGP